MRVHEISCPKCRAGLKSKAGVLVGSTLSCPKCKQKFTVEAPLDEPDIVDDIVEDTDVIETEDVRPSKKGPPPPPPPPKKKVKAREDDPTEEIQVRKSKKSARRDEDDDDEAPRPKKKKKKQQQSRYDDEDVGLYARLKGNIFVRVITLVVLLGVLAVMAYLLYEKKKAEREDASTLSTHIALQVDLDRSGMLL